MVRTIHAMLYVICGKRKPAPVQIIGLAAPYRRFFQSKMQISPRRPVMPAESVYYVHHISRKRDDLVKKSAVSAVADSATPQAIRQNVRESGSTTITGLLVALTFVGVVMSFMVKNTKIQAIASCGYETMQTDRTAMNNGALGNQTLQGFASAQPDESYGKHFADGHLIFKMKN